MTQSWWCKTLYVLLFFVHFVTSTSSTLASPAVVPLLSASNAADWSYTHFSTPESNYAVSIYSLPVSASLSAVSSASHYKSAAVSLLSHNVLSSRVSHPDILSSFTFSAYSFSSSEDRTHPEFSIVSASFQLSFTYSSHSDPFVPFVPPALVVLRLQFAVGDETVASFTSEKQAIFIAVLMALVMPPPSAVEITAMRDVPLLSYPGRRLAADTVLDMVVDVTTESSTSDTLVQLCSNSTLTDALTGAGMPLALTFVGYTRFNNVTSVPPPPDPDEPVPGDDVSRDNSDASFTSSPAFVVVVVVPSFFGFALLSVLGRRMRKVRGNRLPFINVVVPQSR